MPTGLTSPEHLFVIIFVALIVLGPEKLPAALRQVGRTMGEVRRWTDSISGELRGALSLDAGDEGPPAAAPAPVAPTPTTSGNGVMAPLAPAPLPPAPAQAPAGPAAAGAQAGTDPARHPALQRGGEWS